MADASISPPLTVEDLRKTHSKPRNIFKEVDEKASKLDKAACWITEKVGTMGFFLVIFIWTFFGWAGIF